MGREGKRGGRGKGRGGPQNTGTDQYGDDHFDRDDAPPSFGGRGGRAGGGGDDDASTSRPTGVNLEVDRSVPKFLQQYAHLLEKGPKKRPRPAVEEGERDDDDEGDAGARLQEAVQRALEEDPAARAAMSDAQLRRVCASAAKELGNAAFKARDYSEAVAQYTAAIEADNTDAAFYSNRSAAHAALGEWEGARRDAAQAASLKPGWPKAWARLGAAHMGLHAWSKAKEAYARARELEPDDQTIETAWAKADYEERQASQGDKFTFNRNVKQPGGGAAEPASDTRANRAAPTPRAQQRPSGGGARRGRAADAAAASAAPQATAKPGGSAAKRPMLSFAEDEEDD